jgi:hypothetical protein
MVKLLIHSCLSYLPMQITFWIIPWWLMLTKLGILVEFYYSKLLIVVVLMLSEESQHYSNCLWHHLRHITSLNSHSSSIYCWGCTKQTCASYPWYGTGRVVVGSPCSWGGDQHARSRQPMGTNYIRALFFINTCISIYLGRSIDVSLLTIGVMYWWRQVIAWPILSPEKFEQGWESKRNVFSFDRNK